MVKIVQKGEKRRKNVIKSPKFGYFSSCNTLGISRNENNSKKVKKSFEKVLEGNEKCVSLHSQNNGNAGLKMREVVQRSSLRE